MKTSFWLWPKRWALKLALLVTIAVWNAAAADWVTYEGQSGPGKGKQIVFLAGDEEYRSEEALPMLAKILAAHHGFKCTVLFSINPADHTIDPNTQTNILGMEALDAADLCVMLLRFRDLPDSQMRHFVDYLKAGKPVLGLRTSTHAFQFQTHQDSPYAKYDWRSKAWPGGFGQQVLGDTWVNHHGEHGKQSTRGIIEPDARANPILKGVENIWGPTDVYTVAHLPPDATILLRGEVLTGMKPDDPPLSGSKNEPMMPIAWTRERAPAPDYKPSRVFTTTMGAAVDLQNEGLRRLLVNACYWALKMESKIPEKADVAIVGNYQPTWFGFGKHKPGMRPADFEDK